MMRLLRAAAPVAAALVLTACAATGPRFTEVERSLPALRAGEGRIFVFRENTPVGAAVRPDVRVNGEVAGEAQPGSFFFVDRPAGRYTASARTESESTVDFELAEGASAYLRLQIQVGLLVGRPQLTLHPPGSGADALRDLAYIGSIPLIAAAAAASSGAVPQPPRQSQRQQGPVTMDDLRGLMPATQKARP